MWLECHGLCSELARVETIWVMVWTVAIPAQIPRSPIHRLLADGLSQHGCRQVCDDHLAGKDRHNYWHEMTPVGPPVASLAPQQTD